MSQNILKSNSQLWFANFMKTECPNLASGSDNEKRGKVTRFNAFSLLFFQSLIHE